MTERWMKEKASKSFGGSCMSKFVLENERKRILRLKNMKSSIVKLCQHENSWMKNNIEKRCREIKQSRRNLSGSRNHVGGGGVSGGGGEDNHVGKEVVEDFDLVFHPNVDVTKSGLKLRLTNTTTNNINTNNEKATASNLRVRHVKKVEEHKHSKSTNGLVDSISNNQNSDLGGSTREIILNTESKSTMKNVRNVIINEGKENQSPSHSCHVVPKEKVTINNVTKTRTAPSGINIGKKKNGLSSVSSTKDELKSKDTSRSVDKNDTLNRNKDKLHGMKTLPKMLLKQAATNISTNHKESSRNKVEGSSRSSVIVKTKANIAVPRQNEKKKKFQQLHANRGVSLTSLSKEKEEALAMLKELDITKPSSSCSTWGKKTEDNKKKNVVDHSKEMREFTPTENLSNVDHHLNDKGYDYSKSSIEGSGIKVIDYIEKDHQSAIEECFSSPETSQSSSDDCIVSSTDLVDTQENLLDNVSKDISCRNDSYGSYSTFDGSKIKDEDCLNSIVEESFDEKSGSDKSIIKEDNADNDSDCKISDQISVDHSIAYSSNFDSDKSDEVSLETILTDEANNKSSSTNVDRKCSARKSKSNQNDIDWTPQFKAESFFEQLNL